MTRHPEGHRAPAPIDLVVETIREQNSLWVCLRGEADLGNHQRLQRELAGIDLDGAASVHLVLNELSFCDLYALRHLLTFATRVRAAGREFDARGACATLKKVATLLQVTEELHFV